MLKKLPKSILFSMLGIIFAVAYVVNASRTEPRPIPIHSPAGKPFPRSLSGLGIVESYDLNVIVSPFRAGRITDVWVREGDSVRKGQVLYRLEDADLRAQWASQRADAQAKKAYLDMLKHQPRPEDVAPVRADFERAKANYEDLLSQLQKYRAVRDPRAISRTEMNQKQFAVLVAQRQMKQAESNLKKLLAGAWKYDIQQAEADYQSALAKAEQTQVQVNQSVIHAPRDGRILQVNIRPGEYLSATPADPPVLLGNPDKLQLRVDIDEVNASLVQPDMPAVAYLKGDSTRHFPLKFVRIEPYMVPKKNLSGDNAERVDVRVLQLIYTFDPPPFPVYTGQQTDVFLNKRSL